MSVRPGNMVPVQLALRALGCPVPFHVRDTVSVMAQGPLQAVEPVVAHLGGAAQAALRHVPSLSFTTQQPACVCHHVHQGNSSLLRVCASHNVRRGTWFSVR